METRHIYSENELLQQLAKGDANAFRVVYDHFYLPVFRFAQQFTKHHQTAEDIATDSFLKLWEKRSGFTEWNKVKSFLFTTVRNACLNYLRDTKRHEQHHDQLRQITTLETEYDLTHHPVAERMYAYLEEEISRLPEKLKNILLLQLQGHTNTEIAAKMGLAEKTVRNLKVDAIKALRIALLMKDSPSLLPFALLLLTMPPKMLLMA